MKQNEITNFDIVKNAVTDFQNKTGKEVYLSKFKFGYFTGALDFGRPDQYEQIMKELDLELKKAGDLHAEK